MSFTIDRQSQDELNLMGKFRQGSVYFIFNQVKTRGGEQLLEQYFKHPLMDEQQLNHRTDIFRFFQHGNWDFPFDPQQVVLMQEYVDAATESGQLRSYGNILLKKTLSALTRDHRYKALIQGLQATIVTLKKCYAFATLLRQAGGSFSDRVEKVLQVLGSSNLSGLMNTDIYADIPVRKMAEFDHLLKTRMNQQVRDVLQFIAELDVNIAVSKVAASKGFTYAKALPKETNLLRAVDLKHPAIEKATGNNIEMKKDSNVIFLTGANMAGKSTWMKSIGISMYLAHIGFPVAAKSMEFSVREGIYSSINVADNIALGYSHFYAEVVRVKQAAEASSTGKHLLLMFDELFKGTNVKDAYDGTLAVTEAFSEYSNCLFIVSTHIIEVGEALRHRKNIRFVFMPTILEQAIPRYTYRLKEGITEDRQGMMIIRNEGILEMIGQ